ncbi:MAG TPA: YceI family protein [Vicinamibacterales bacterium]|nr:YceI family protein [Vicinamibacterales bacterium]
MSTTTPASSTTTPTLTAWSIDPAHSHIEFAIRHLMIATVKGRFGIVHGTVYSDDADPAKGRAQIEIDVDSIDTREAQRDAHLKSADFFDAATFPKITFTSTRIADVSGDRFKLIGDLTMHGVTREVALDVTSEGRNRDPWGGERAGFTATTKIKRSDFGLTWNQALETGGVLVGDDVKVSLEIELVKQQ